jgi:hypothetical protein
MDTILNPFNTVHTSVQNLGKIYFSIITLCNPVSAKWSVSVIYSDKHMRMHFSSPACLVVLHVQPISSSLRI